jgi:hypothetical protein
MNIIEDRKEDLHKLKIAHVANLEGIELTSVYYNQ